jgi:site-specific recombinase XerD
MRPQLDPKRQCLKLDEWPAIDRHAWLAAIADDDPFSTSAGVAARWRPHTVHKNRRGYGRWLTFLENQQVPHTGCPLASITREHVRTYLTELQAQGVSHLTLRNRILELYATARVFKPDADLGWLRTVGANLSRTATRCADKSMPPFLAPTLLKRSSSELRRLADHPFDRRSAIKYRNWLIIHLASVVPLRLSNLARLDSKAHLRVVNGRWFIDIKGSEMKTGRDYAATFPDETARLLDRYLASVRPVLTGSQPRIPSTKLWIGARGRPLAEHSIYLIITKLTRAAFGTQINPHLFRHIFATTVSIVSPEVIEGARAALGHAGLETTRQYYNRASGIQASRDYGALVARLRNKSR